MMCISELWCQLLLPCIRYGEQLLWPKVQLRCEVTNWRDKYLQFPTLLATFSILYLYWKLFKHNLSSPTLAMPSSKSYRMPSVTYVLSNVFSSTVANVQDTLFWSMKGLNKCTLLMAESKPMSCVQCRKNSQYFLSYTHCCYTSFSSHGRALFWTSW